MNQNPETAILNPESAPSPTIVYGTGIDPNLHLDPALASRTFKDLGISDETINNTTIFLDPKSRSRTFGTHYPNMIGKMRFLHEPEVRQSKGDVIRLSTVMKGEPRSTDGINYTFVHEAEHLAQADRKDRKLTEGHIAIYGLALAGALAGNKLGRSKSMKTLGTIIGIAAGHTLGYMAAPHERQARTRAKQVHSAAITRKAQ